MREIEVTLDVISSSRTLAELREIVGIDGSDGSHDGREKRPNGKPRISSRLRIDSDLPPTASFEGQLRSLSTKLPPLTPPSDVDVVITVAHYFDTPMSSIETAVAVLCHPLFQGYSMEVVSYPCAPKPESFDVQ